MAERPAHFIVRDLSAVKNAALIDRMARSSGETGDANISRSKTRAMANDVSIDSINKRMEDINKEVESGIEKRANCRIVYYPIRRCQIMGGRLFCYYRYYYRRYCY